MKTLLFLPAYNCATQLDRVLKSIDPKLANRFQEIVVIDNISQDNTVDIALSFKQLIPNLRIIQNSKNISLGGSHKVAFLLAEQMNATHVAILHGDDQAVAGELHQLLDIAELHPEYDAVFGSRFMKGSKLNGYDWKRIIGNRVLNIIYTIFTGRYCKDLGSGLNLIKMEILRDHIYLGFANRLTFNFELLLFLIRRDAKFIYHPITWRESDQVSNARNFNIAIIAILNLIKWRFSNAYPPPLPGSEYQNFGSSGFPVGSPLWKRGVRGDFTNHK